MARMATKPPNLTAVGVLSLFYFCDPVPKERRKSKEAPLSGQSFKLSSYATSKPPQVLRISAGLVQIHSCSPPGFRAFSVAIPVASHVINLGSFVILQGETVLLFVRGYARTIWIITCTSA